MMLYLANDKLDVFFVPVIMVTGDVASLVLEYLAIFFFYI